VLLEKRVVEHFETGMGEKTLESLLFVYRISWGGLRNSSNGIFNLYTRAVIGRDEKIKGRKVSLVSQCLFV
jgi:hypothetical protein